MPLLHDAAALARTFANERLLPRLRELEHHGGAPSKHPRPSQDVPLAHLMKDLADTLGLADLARDAVQDTASNEGIMADPELGAAILTELTRKNPGFALSFGASLGLCGQSILRNGTPAQQREWAQPVLAFDKIGCWALTEPEAGSDAFSLTTRARRDGDRYVLSGEKAFITNAPIADTFVVYARIQGADPLDGQIRPFLLDRADAGLTTSAPLEKMGMKSSPTGSIFLDEVPLPFDRLLGDPDVSGKRSALTTLLGERAALAGMSLAIIEESLELALAYAKERKQFGQPIAQFQAVQLRLARMYAAQETVRALIDRGRKLVSEGDASLAFFCAAKYTASTLATTTALEAVQVLGGAGYCSDHRVEGLARDAKLLEIGGGTSDIQLLAIAKDLLKQ
ncbi:MAG: acyl-CoA dehydrogenase family protein [Deltaproteobacteria bacterium]|nr:acyl-CoA dehydrogenase family protein [Deltaproteobacteria bacterium]